MGTTRAGEGAENDLHDYCSAMSFLMHCAGRNGLTTQAQYDPCDVQSLACEHEPLHALVVAADTRANARFPAHARPATMTIRFHWFDNMGV